MNVVNEMIKNNINEIIAVYNTLINISGSLYVGRIISWGITIHEIDSASFMRILAAINERTGIIAMNKHPIPRHNGWGSGIEGLTTLLEKIVCLGIFNPFPLLYELQSRSYNTLYIGINYLKLQS